jgi:hypothetical protein
MNFLRYLYSWLKSQRLYFWAAGLLLLVAGVVHFYINTHVSSICFGVFVGGGFVILADIIKSYRAKKDA